MPFRWAAASHHPDAGVPLQAWRKAMEGHVYTNFSALRQVFGSVDKVDELHVFNIGGNKYRLIVFLHPRHQMAYIKHVLTHAEYDRDTWRKS